MDNKTTRTVAAEQVREFVSAILRGHGVPAEDAMITADHLVKANLRGVDTHGVIRLKGYIARIKAGGNNPRPKISVVKESSFGAVMDGGNGLGQVGGRRAMELAIKKAGESGIGIVVLRNSNHYGMAGYYSMMPLKYDMLGLSMTNVLACMAPTGGTAGRVGNNPISLALPAGEEPPVVLDMASSKSSWGRALLCQEKGEPLPEDCFMDVNGNPTLDADAFLDGGTLLPIAEHKGYGIALGISLLCGLLADGPFDTELPHLYKKLDAPGGNSFLMAAAKVDTFAPIAHFKKRMDKTIAMIRATPRAAGVSGIYLPGQIEHETELKRRQSGIPINETLISDLQSLAEEIGLDVSDYEFLN